MPETNSTLNKIDAWSGTHLFGSFTLTILFALIFTAFDACILAFCLGYLWELNDNRHEKYRQKHSAAHPKLDSLFDPRGFSWMDLLLDLIGCFSAFLCLRGLV